MTEMKIALSIEEAADYTGIGRNTLRDLVKWKKLPVLQVGRKVLIKTDILEQFMEANEGRDLRCFLQALFGQNCKIFLDIVAKRFWTLLHVQIGQSCNAPAGCVINQP